MIDGTPKLISFTTKLHCTGICYSLDQNKIIKLYSQKINQLKAYFKNKVLWEICLLINILTQLLQLSFHRSSEFLYSHLMMQKVMQIKIMQIKLIKFFGINAVISSRS